jgi:hypothetical protein
MTFRIMGLRIKGLHVTLSINGIQHEQPSAKSWSAIMLSVIMLNGVMLSVIMQSVVAPSLTV